MVSDEVIKERLALLAEYIEDLKAEQGINFDHYRNDKKTRRYIEHTLQIAIEVCLDMSHHIIAEKHLPLSKENQGIFDALGEAKPVLFQENYFPHCTRWSGLEISWFANMAA